MTADGLITREEVLGGLPARRAGTLLFLIESRTAHLVVQSRRVTERFLTEDTEKERELAFYEAFTLGRDPKPPPTIQDLERFAPQWAQLVPESANLRAAIARALGQRYIFTYEAVPGIRLALGLDEDRIKDAYNLLYREPLETVYATEPGFVERLRWAWASLSTRLENLPPFWAVYALTLTETVGAGILALPIAIAGIGPLPGIAILAALGLVNVLTIAFMAEAAARSGTIRYGSAYVGRMVADFLGDMGSVVLSGGLIAICALALLAYYIGFSTTMASVTLLPTEVWVAVLFAVGLYFVSRESLNTTVASALVIGAVNIGLILTLSLLASTHLQPENLAYANVPFINGAPFDPSILTLIFGVILTAYFGHLSVSTASKTVMRRDPSGRSLIWGAAAAQLTAMTLYCIWVFAVNGAIGPQQLAGETGTALVPLVTQLGPIASGFGSIFVILAMGMVSIHFSLGLFGLTRERLPMQPRPTLTMPSGRARLLFRHLGARSPQVALTYLGLERDQPCFGFDICVDGQMHRVEVHVDERWRADLSEQITTLAGDKIRLELEILGATQQSVRLRVSSPMRIAYEGEWDVEGLSVANLLMLPESEGRIVTWIMRQRGTVSLSVAAEHLGWDTDAARGLLDRLVGQGFLRQVEGDGEPHYRANVGYRRGSQVVQQLLAPPGRQTMPASATQKPRTSIGQAIFGGRGRFLLSITPLALVFLLAEWTVITDSQTFSGILSLLGVLVVSLLAGIFPVFLLISSRHKGEFVPEAAYRLMGNPAILAFIYLLSLSSIFLHGLVIWEGLVERAIALMVGTLAVVMTIAMARRGAFSPRAVVELCEDQSGEENQSFLSVVAGGRPALADARLEYADGERRVEARGGVTIPALSDLRSAAVCRIDAQARELKVWLHKVTREGNSEGLPAQVEVRCGEEVQRSALNLADGQVVLSLSSEPEQLRITLSD